MTISKMFAIAAVASVLAMGSLNLNAAAAPQENQAGAAAESQVTLTGCLDGSGGVFTLTAQGGERYAVMGSPDLAKHVGHTVRITGAKSDATGKLTLKVEKIEQISASCEG